MDSENKIYLLLKNYKNKLDIIRGNSIEKIILTLKFNSDYDELFFNETQKLNLDKTDIKKNCISDILKTYYDNTKIACDKSYLNKFSEIPNQELNMIVKDYFRIKEVNFNYATINTISKYLNEQVEFYIFEKECQRGNFIKNIKDDLNSRKILLPFLNDLFKIDTKEEKVFIKLFLTARFYQVINYYLTYDFNSALDEKYYEVDEINYNIYNALDNIKHIIHVINIFDTYSEIIIKSNCFYSNLSKIEKENIVNSIIEDSKEMNFFRIFPYMIFEYNSYYNLKFKSDDLESVIIGRNVLSIVQDLSAQVQSGNLQNDQLYLKCVQLIKSNYQNINYLKVFKYIASNIYENLCVKNDVNSDEENYIDLIESAIDYEEMLENTELLAWIIYKFYEFNGDFFEENELRLLKEKVDNKNKVYLKKLNPYYDEEEKYLK